MQHSDRSQANVGTAVPGAGVALAALPRNTAKTAANIRAGYLNACSKQRNHPGWPAGQSQLNGGAAPTFNYHRSRAQAGFANLVPNG